MTGNGVDPAVTSKMVSLFKEYAGGPENIPDIIRSQGYAVEETSPGIFRVSSGNTEWTVRFDHVDNIMITEVAGRTEKYPIYAAGMFTCLDPSRRWERRQARLEYHWPDTSIPGR